MDELDLLKKEWNREDSSFKNYTERELFTMIKGRSVSVAKTVFIIALCEIALYFLFGFLSQSNGKVSLFVEILDWISMVLPFVISCNNNLP